MQIQQASRLATTAQTDTVSTPVHDQQERAPTLASSQGKGAVLPLTQVSQPPVTPSSKGDVICATCGPRQVEITRHQDGSASVTMQHPPLTSLVLSGGGAKGAAYPGAIKALEEQGKLAEIRTMSGSSAGAITASLLAAGMNAGEFKTLSDEMNLISLLDSPVKKISLAQHMSGENGKVVAGLFEKIKLSKVGSFIQLLCNILPRLQSEAVPLERILKKESNHSVLAHLDARPELNARPEVAAIRQRLGQGGGVTFGDLALLSRHIPAIKELNITGTGMFDGRPQMIVFNASLTPDMEIARAAHISGSFPIVFSRPEVQSQPFLKEGERLSLQDGGVMLNVPVPELINPDLGRGVIAEHDNLILKFEDDGSEEAKKGTVKGALADWVVGAPVGARSALQAKGLADFADQMVTVPLKTERGDFTDTLGGTLNFTMSDADKGHLQEKLADAVNSHLTARESDRQYYHFEDLESALLALPDRDFAAVAQEGGQELHATAQFRQQAQEHLSTLVASVLTQEAAPRLSLSAEMAHALTQLDTLAESPARREWIVGQLNQPDNTALARLLNSDAPSGQFPILDQGKSEARSREVSTVARNIIHEVIYPSLFRLGQPGSNVALLRRTEHALKQAQTATEVNRALQELADNYGARNKPWSKPLSSTTVNQAKAWMMVE